MKNVKDIIISLLLCLCIVVSGATFLRVKVIQGEQGIQGIQGERGEKGDKGEQGERGAVYYLPYTINPLDEGKIIYNLVISNIHSFSVSFPHEYVYIGYDLLGCPVLFYLNERTTFNKEDIYVISGGKLKMVIIATSLVYDRAVIENHTSLIKL